MTNLLSVSAEEDAEMVFKVSDERGELLLRLNDYKRSQENFDRKEWYRMRRDC